MARTKTIVRGAAFVAAATLALTGCSSADEPTATGTTTAEAGEPLKIGSLLPLTGSLAFLGPPEVAGVDLAVQEINAAGGVNGVDVEVTHKDSSDTANPQIASASVADLISDGVGAIIGAASSSVSLNVVDDIANAQVVMFSPANTSTALSGYSPFYWRVAPPDTVQGDALANLMLNDGNTNIGVLVFNDDYGTSLRDVVQDVVESKGGTITYGAAGQEFDPNASNFSSDVAAILATSPDAIAVIAFDQTKQIIPEMVAGGFPSDKIYLVDGNTTSYEDDFEAGTLAGAKGTIPGAFPDPAFADRLNSVAPGGTLDGVYAYGPESYDATMLTALAAVRGGGTDGVTIRDNLAAVSGANGGTECSGFAECRDLLEAGTEIMYVAVAGSGSFNSDNDPASAFIGVYQFGEDNIHVWIDAVYGEV